MLFLNIYFLIKENNRDNILAVLLTVIIGLELSDVSVVLFVPSGYHCELASVHEKCFIGYYYELAYM